MPYYLHLADVFEVASGIGFRPNPEFYLSSAGFVLGTLSGAYLLFKYYKNGRASRFLFRWLIGLALVYWFRIPTILANAGSRFVLQNFNLFLAAAFPASLLGFILMLTGVQSVWPSLSKKTLLRFSLVWLGGAALFFSVAFLKTGFTNYLPAFLVNVAIFPPVRALILYSLWRWYRGWGNEATTRGRAGILLMAAGMLLGIGQHFVALYRLLHYPPELWFLALQSFAPLFILETAGTLLLILGVFLVYKDCLRLQK